MANQNPPAGSGGDDPNAARPNNPKEIRHDAFFDRAGLDPTQVPEGLVCYPGILAKGPREGYWRLYLGLDMSEYLEIRAEDIVTHQPLEAQQSPFGSLGGTLVCVRKGAQIQHVQTSSSQLQAGGEFDLNVQLGAQRMAGPQLLPFTGFTCPDNDTCPRRTCITCAGDDTCPRRTCITCAGDDTCPRTQCQTCNTCMTNCNQNTCQMTQCNQNTCQMTQCNQNTCQMTQCNQDTCQTCMTRCRQDTCQLTQCNQNTCQTCATRCFDTCAPCQTELQTHCFTCRAGCQPF